MKKPSWTKNIRAIGWDLDGTLYPPNSIPSDEIQNMQYLAVAKANNWSTKKAIEEFKTQYSKLGSHTKTLTALGVDGAKFFTTLWDKLPLEKFIKKDSKINLLFSTLSSFTHFIITNSNSKKQVKTKLSLVGLPTKTFKFIVTTDKLGVVKPDPKPYQIALKKLELTPNQVLFVGDRLTTDIRGAKGVGMRTCLVYSKSNKPDISLENVYQVSNLF